MADVFDQYSMADAWDEMFERPGEPRPAYRSLFATLQPLSVADLRSRADQLARVFTDRGVTFAPGGRIAIPVGAHEGGQAAGKHTGALPG